ncbi:LptF/LptG family permease [Synoicihabitans lomoniglobus]|uniref:LptF/LptG family permease n=1 Tax=Synoicihabitans lomoniglobus TaxID=2909285 RepID=A0AAF0CPR2_9BACT|nr:LptF/LptG family permease [Opitutaceae bacterium LMO-M01]WED65798.1 LptF/LptG family permease [Opitutaceae bacterium LMO-M01]
MTLIDRYVLREWLGSLGLVLGATMGLLLMQSMYDDLGDLLDAGAGGIDIIFYYLVRLPSFLSLVLTLSLLLSLLYTLGRLHRNLEITAMRAAGLGFGRITRVIWVAGVMLCGVTWYLNGTVIPWSVETSRSILQDLRVRGQGVVERVDQVEAVNSVAFDNRRENRVWFMNRYSRYTNRGYGVVVTELDAERREKTRMQAREAWFDTTRGGWVFLNGRETWINPDTGEVQRTLAFDEKVVTHYREDPALMLVFDQKPDDLSFFELERVIAFHRTEDSPKLKQYAVRYFGLLAETLGPLIIISLAIPFAVSGVRVNPAVGVSKSIGLFVIYFVLFKISTAMGSRGMLEPMWAALAPNLIMLLLGLGLMARAR